MTHAFATIGLSCVHSAFADAVNARPGSASDGVDSLVAITPIFNSDDRRVAFEMKLFEQCIHDTRNDFYADV